MIKLFSIFGFMFKVAIIELAGHFEVARAYSKMALSLGYEVDMLITEANYIQLKSVYNSRDKISWHIMQNEFFSDYIDRYRDVLEKCDIVICCTPETKSGFVLSKTWSTMSCLVIHDVNNYFDYKHNINWYGGLKQYFRILKYFSMKYFSRRQKAMLTFDKVIVPSSIMKEHARMLAPSLNMKVLPFLYNETIPKINTNEICTIIIPGTVNQRSRDYLMVYQVFKKILEAGLLTKIKLVLLGKISGKISKEIVCQLLSLNSPNFSVIVFQEVLATTDFDSIIQEADFLLLPLQTKWIYGVVNEVGGVTCLSGNIGDMVRYGMPALLPCNYKIQEELAPLVTYYKTDFENATKEWSAYISNIVYNKIKLKAKDTMYEFNKIVRQNFIELLQ